MRHGLPPGVEYVYSYDRATVYPGRDVSRTEQDVLNQWGQDGWRLHRRETEPSSALIPGGVVTLHFELKQRVER